jgi:hypothetical protein
VAARFILFGTVLICVPSTESTVVWVICIVDDPPRKMAEPEPVVVVIVRVIGTVLLAGATVAVIGAVEPMGTTGVL